ncbi:MAG: coenzyme F420-0:L-glutamate ligase [Candidatus Hydrothermarchaeota archaeon]|nr:MAG: coenzyme F420-0:L-glutamate ligase [Candidatus Hydrothermarchaeota archaeon]
MMLAIGLNNLPLIKEGDELEKIIAKAIEEKGIKLEDGDIIVVTEKIVSKAEGRVIELNKIKASKKAQELAEKTGKDPRLVELMLREFKEVIKIGENFIIGETKHGFICANAGIDQSNIEEGKVKLLPENPDKSAERIRKFLEKKFNVRLGLIISDSFGRPFRKGSVGVALGASGVIALQDRRGNEDIYGKKLRVTRVAIADCLASLAILITGEGNERIPVVIIKGLDYLGEGKASDLLREKEKDVFR